MDWPELLTPKYEIGDIVSIKEHNIDEAIIIGIRLFSRTWCYVDGVDYVFTWLEDGKWVVGELSEENLD